MARGYTVDGERVRELRDDHMMTQKELGAKAGLSDKVIFLIENRKGKIVYGRTLRKLANALEVDWRELKENGSKDEERIDSR